MKNGKSVETYRSLAQLEGELKKAELGYVSADARLRDAEARRREAEAHLRGIEELVMDAETDRNAALRTLNDCHSEIDSTIALLREASPSGSQWKGKAERTASILLLKSDSAFEPGSDFILKADSLS